jgi:carbon starvation protein
VTTVATWEKVVSSDVRVGFLAAANKMAASLAAGTLPAEQAAVAPQLIFNQRLDAALSVILAAILWVVIADTVRVCLQVVRGLPASQPGAAPGNFI